MAYDNKEQLFDLLNKLEISDEEQYVRITGHSDPFQMDSDYIPLSNFKTRLEHSDLIAIISRRKFCSHMQPIISAKDEKIYAYEFLLRPLPGEPDFQPFQLFDVARQSGLHSFLDRQARISAIETSARKLPHGIKRFINFLPSSIYNPNYCLSHTFEAIEKYNLDPSDFVFEVVETEKIDDVNHLQNVFDVYRQSGIRVALDDVGAGFSTTQLVEELKPDFVKIDRDIIRNCEQGAGKQRVIQAIVDTAQSYNGIVLAEGIERLEEWEYLKHAGVDLGQGFLFGSPQLEPIDYT
ncbi:hypothetical protein GCM10010916_40560 [Paenibacillus abyssi]|uniref:EAL domain-containing protein n=2 Tax=Paenibacillus abyssi TaxID=1340531 RepID=A0A917G2E2_9BACL|nr:hypothetical protein GCM10010916_40560 [Paenibacillus abyssi]